MTTHTNYEKSPTKFNVVFWDESAKDGGSSKTPFTAGPFDSEADAEQKADRLRRNGWPHVVVCLDEPEDHEEE